MHEPNFRLTKLACYISYIVQAISVNIASLFFVIFREDYGLSFTDLGFLVLFTFLVQLAIDIISIKIIAVLGYKKSAIIANIFACTGIIMLSILPGLMPPLWALLISVFFYSLGGGLIEVVINPIIEAVPSDSLGASFSLLHSFYSWGQTAIILITTLLLFVVGNKNWNSLPLIWATVPFINIFLFIKAPVPEIESESSLQNSKNLVKNPIFIAFLLLMLCGGSTEMVISQWASYFAEKGLGVTKVIGDLLGPCIFALMMALGRTAYGIFGKKLPIFKVLIFCSFLGVVAYVGISFIPNPLLVMVCFALAGIASSLLWPGTLSASAKAIPRGGTVMFALLAFAGDAGCSLGPWINGLINDYVTANESAQIMTKLGFSVEQASLRSAILISAIFPALMFITLIIIASVIKKKSPDNTNS